MEVWVLPTVEAIVHCNMPEQSTLHTQTSVHIFSKLLFTHFLGR